MPSHQYELLPRADCEESSPPLPSPSHRQFRLKRIFIRRPRSLFALISIIVVVLTFLIGIHLWSTISALSSPHNYDPLSIFPNGTLSFDESPRPPYMDTVPQHPLVLRIAIISRRDEFERRKAIRDGMLHGISSLVLAFEYQFFIGGAPDSEYGTQMRFRITDENRKYKDVVLLNNIVDIPERLSEKRYAALKWAGEAPRDTYDYFLTLDSDTFCRLPALAHSIPMLYAANKDKNKNQPFNPRTQPILIGRMGSHLTYFQNTVPDGSNNLLDADQVIRGPWFPYPLGIGYMLSSSLITTILSASPPVPHHIHYPSDDVMIGAWIEALRVFPNASASEFSTIASSVTPENPNPEPEHTIKPTPYLPYKVDTVVINSAGEGGWHDFPGRPAGSPRLGWGSTCIHRWTTEEMMAFRTAGDAEGRKWI